MRERSRAWLLLTALLFVALIEVKMLMAGQLMCSLALAAVVYLIIFSNADLFKIAGCTAIGAIPLVSWVLLKNRSSAQIVTKFEPWLYVSHAMQTLGLGNWLSGPLAFAVVALPIYLVGCLGLRVIGVPAILTAIFRPRPEGALRFLLGIFVVIGVVIALTCSFTPAGWTFRYNPISSTFLVQSEYVAWIFAVEVFQTLYQWAIRRGIYPALAAGGITVTAAGLSLPATVQHFVVWRDPDHFFGTGKPFGRQLLTYDLQTLAAMDFLQTDAHPGDVALTADNLIAPVLALTKCRVPVGYFALGLVGRSDYTRRETAEKKFWTDWRLGKVEDGLLQDANVRYVVVNKQTEGIPATIPASLSKVFENSEFAVFKVDPQRLSETVPQSPIVSNHALKIARAFLFHGRHRHQTACANFAWTRLGFFQRSAQGFRKSRGWRCDFAQGRQRSFDWERHLQFEIANCCAPFLAAKAGP